MNDFRGLHFQTCRLRNHGDTRVSQILKSDINCACKEGFSGLEIYSEKNLLLCIKNNVGTT